VSSDLLLTTGVVAAVITALVTLGVSILNSRLLFRIERSKRRTEFETYRFKALVDLKRKIAESGVEFDNAALVDAMREGNEGTFADFATELGNAYLRIVSIMEGNRHYLTDQALETIFTKQEPIDAITMEVQEYAMREEIDSSSTEGEVLWQKTASRFSLILEYLDEVASAVDNNLRQIKTYLSQG